MKQEKCLSDLLEKKLKFFFMKISKLFLKKWKFKIDFKKIRKVGTPCYACHYKKIEKNLNKNKKTFVPARRKFFYFRKLFFIFLKEL
jgi:hypothetical protein